MSTNVTKVGCQGSSFQAVTILLAHWCSHRAQPVSCCATSRVTSFTCPGKPHSPVANTSKKLDREKVEPFLLRLMHVKLFVVYKPQLATSRHFKGGSSGIRVIISNSQLPGLEQHLGPKGIDKDPRKPCMCLSFPSWPTHGARWHLRVPDILRIHLSQPSATTKVFFCKNTESLWGKTLKNIYHSTIATLIDVTGQRLRNSSLWESGSIPLFAMPLVESLWPLPLSSASGGPSWCSTPSYEAYMERSWAQNAFKCSSSLVKRIPNT